jgi:hypothetical protein
MPTAVMALGAILVGFALQIKDGFYTASALGVLLVAILCCAIATLRLAPAARLSDPTLVRSVLIAGIAANLVALAVSRPGMYLEQPLPSQHPGFLAGLAIAAALIAAGLSGTRALGLDRLWFPLTLATFTGLGLWMTVASPDPHVDVVTVYKYSWKALLHGKSPFAMTFPNIYGDDSLYPPGMVSGGRVLFGFPYPPLSLLLGLPGLWLGDVRYAMLAALIGGAALIGSARSGLIAPLAATLLLTTPRGLFVIEQAWTEPLMLLAFGATIWAALRAPRTLPIMLGLLIATKQYMIVAVPLAWLLTQPEQRWGDWLRLVWIAIAVATIVTLPFALWNVDGFVRSVITLQFHERFRLDSLSLLTWIVYARPFSLTASERLVQVSALALVGGLLISLWRASRTPAGFAAAVALTLIGVFVCSKKAFCNYYFLALGLMCASIAATDFSVPRPAPPSDAAGRRDSDRPRSPARGDAA